jgi:hypothetical protein
MTSTDRTNRVFDVTFSARVVVSPDGGSDEAIEFAVAIAESYGMPALAPNAVYVGDTDDETTWPTDDEEQAR